MSRSYLVFGSDDEVNWAQMETVQASGSTQALNLARAQAAHNHYAVVPERNWTAGTPSVKQRPPVIHWEMLTPGQMQIEDEDALDEIKDAIADAKQAIAGPKEKEGVA